MLRRDKFYLSLIIVIFAAGFLIYGVNKLRGVDLAAPPKIDVSAFDLKLSPPVLKFDDKEVAAPVDEAAIEVLKNKIQALAVAEEKHKIFFGAFFKQETPEETEKFIKNFLVDFSDLQKYPLVATCQVGAVEGCAATLDFGDDAEKIKPTLDKLEKEFGGVVVIKR
jgi:hypothetical protein